MTTADSLFGDEKSRPLPPPKTSFTLTPNQRAHVIDEVQAFFCDVLRMDLEGVNDDEIEAMIKGCLGVSKSMEDVIGCVKTRLLREIEKRKAGRKLTWSDVYPENRTEG